MLKPNTAIANQNLCSAGGAVPVLYLPFDTGACRLYHGRLMLRPLPDLIDPMHLAESGRVLRGRLALSKLTRLAGSLHDVSGELVLELVGAKQGKVRTLQGRIETTLNLVCQRCLEPMDQVVDVSFTLALVNSEAQAEQLPGDIEPLLVTGTTLALAELVEDELILALPLVALHPSASPCGLRAVVEQPAAADTGAVETRKNPFAILAQLKNPH